MVANAPFHRGTPVMATCYRRPTANASIRKGGTAPYNTPISGDIQPISVQRDGKLLDLFRDKMRRLHYALATEKAYRRVPLAHAPVPLTVGDRSADYTYYTSGHWSLDSGHSSLCPARAQPQSFLKSEIINP